MALILAIDRPLDASLVRSICGDVDGIKVGLPPVLKAGIDWALEVARSCSKLTILDFKLADIGAIMEASIEPFLGDYDAYIAHSFIGAEGALSELKELLDRRGRKLILVASMSHPGSRDVYDPSIQMIEDVIDGIGPWGLVAPATRPQIVRRLRTRYPDKVILSPGVGAQGAKPGSAICAGATYEIVGRMITGSRDPAEAARRVREAQDEEAGRCRG